MKRAVPAGQDAIAGEDSFADIVYNRIKADILWGTLAPDQPLRSESLKLAYDVGISPLREALTRLSSEGHVVRAAQRGFKVAPLTPQQVMEIAQARILVESEAIRRSIDLGNLAWETEIAAASYSLSRTVTDGTMQPESRQWSEQHQRFHFSLLAGCQSEWLMRIAANLFDHSERHRIVGENWRVSVEASGAIAGRARIAEHESLGQAVLDRNTVSALSMLSRHYMLTAQSVVHVLNGAQNEPVVAAPLAARRGRPPSRRAVG